MLFLDSNAIVYYLHKVEPYSLRIRDILEHEDELYTSMRVIDEVIFTLVRMRAWSTMGIKRIEDLREHVRKQGYTAFRQEITMLSKFLDELNIIVLEDRGGLTELLNIISEFNLLPADAIIALTCKYYGIDAILTFDEDFKKLPWLKVIP